MALVTNLPDIDIKILLSQPTESDLKYWALEGCQPDNQGIVTHSEWKVALPKIMLVLLIRRYNGLSHTSAARTAQAINALYCIEDVRKTTKLVLNSCLICAKTYIHQPPQPYHFQRLHSNIYK